MLECWDSNPEDRPSFIKIGSSLSKALMTMSGYLDVSLVSDGARAQLASQCCTEQGTLVRGCLGFATLAFPCSFGVLLNITVMSTTHRSIAALQF